jgi:hypothetical protein
MKPSASEMLSERRNALSGGMVTVKLPVPSSKTFKLSGTMLVQASPSFPWSAPATSGSDERTVDVPIDRIPPSSDVSLLLERLKAGDA